MTATVDLATAQAPAFATTRNPAARSAGRRVAVVAQALGTPFMPWQQLVADVSTERHPEDPRRFQYPIVVVTVPRQAGKTTLLRAIGVERALSGNRVATFMTAQTGKDAGDRWKDLVGAVERSPIGSHVRAYRGAGAQSLQFPNGSFIRAFAPTPKSIHGATAHLVMLDEIWAFDQVSGEELFAAVGPTQITIPERQLWLVSTAGTARSVFMRDWVDRGREAAAQVGAGLAYFEWSAPEDRDTYDEDGWTFHPALGHTITMQDLRDAAAANSRGNFERSYLNRWTASAAETVVDMDAWAARRGDQDPPPANAVAYAYEVALDRSGASIMAAWRDTEGRLNLRPYRTGPGTDWLAPALVDLHRSGAALFADDGGPTRVVTDELRRQDVDVTTLTGRDSSTAWAAFKSAVTDGTLVHDGSENLTTALALAAERTHLDTPTLSRKHSTGPIDALMAAVVAAWFADRLRTTLQVF